jgi:hypothetical protein
VSASLPNSSVVLQRMIDAVEQVRQRLLKACAALRIARVRHAVIGGNAVAAWVATVDEAAVRNTQDVDILIRRADFDQAREALRRAGFIHRRAAGLDLFLDRADASPRQAVHLIYAEELVKPGELAANPRVEEATDLGAFSVINLDALVRIKLTAFRDKDRTHLRDLIGVGLLDSSWLTRLEPALAGRLQSILDTPDG